MHMSVRWSRADATMATAGAASGVIVPAPAAAAKYDNPAAAAADDDDDDDRPPPTLARSASDSKLDCQSSTSSVVFWYPQRGGGNMSQSNSSVASRSDAGQDDDDHPNHPHPEPYHQLFDRNKRGSLEQVALDRHNLPYAGDVPVDLPGKPNFSQVQTVPSQMPVPNRSYEGLQGRAEEQFCPPGTFDKPNSSFDEMVGQVSLPSRPPGYFNGTGPVHTASLDRGAVRACTAPAGSAGPTMCPPQTFEPQPQRNGLDLTVNDFGDKLGPLNDDPFKADLGDLPPAAQLAQLQLLQNELMRGSRLEAPMGMMPLKTQDFGAAPAQADRHLAFGASNGVTGVQQQLRQQLLESQMQQMQLQQQMQQLQLRQQQLQQQLTQPAPAAGDDEAALTQVPYNDEGERASLGSRLHPDSCNPCIFWFKDKALCNKGVMCDFCHFRHPGQKNKRIRPSKNTRLQMRAAQAARAVA
mmetsp:Transcript_17891/g.37457  ORF Transcript_17891/g.37457 Transcript_17891/m.37457 type:complete len:467 (+) Transcript_17891:74-1474(+)